MKTFLGISHLAILLVAAVTDIYSRKIPNEIIKTGIMLWLAAGFYHVCFSGDLMEMFLNIAAALLISAPIFAVSFLYKKIFGKKAFGGGDIKLLFMTGLFFLPGEALSVLAMSLAAAVVYGVVIKVGEVLKNYTVNFKCQHNIRKKEMVSFNEIIVRRQFLNKHILSTDVLEKIGLKKDEKINSYRKSNIPFAPAVFLGVLYVRLFL